MKILKHPVFITLLSVALIVYLENLLGFAMPRLISHYLNDLLCMPIVLSVCLALIRHLKKDDTIYVPLIIIVLITLYYSFHFEWLLPQFYIRYTADSIDVVLYSIGALMFYIFQKKLF